MRTHGAVTATGLLCTFVALGYCRDEPEPFSNLPLFERAPEKRSPKPEKAKEKLRTLAERWASAVTDMDLTPRSPVTVPPRIKSFEQMLREGHIFLADAKLREALGPDFDGRDLEVTGFCVSLHRWEGEWMGVAGDGCSHHMIPRADDYALASPKKQGATWSFEPEWGTSDAPSIRITKGAGALSVTVSDLETGAWSPPVEVRPSESAHARDSRWHRDAVQAFLEHASVEEPRLVERRHGQWEYRQQRLPRCGLWAWKCDPGEPTLVCGKRGDSEPLLIRRGDGTFTFERVSGELGMDKCGIGPSPGISPPHP
jgi:hypothetical protein